MKEEPIRYICSVVETDLRLQTVHGTAEDRVRDFDLRRRFPEIKQDDHLTTFPERNYFSVGTKLPEGEANLRYVQETLQELDMQGMKGLKRANLRLDGRIYVCSPIFMIREGEGILTIHSDREEIPIEEYKSPKSSKMQGSLPPPITDFPETVQFLQDEFKRALAKFDRDR